MFGRPPKAVVLILQADILSSALIHLDHSALAWQIGRATVPQKDEVITKDECLELCNLFTQLQCKVARHETLPVALEDCFISEQPCTVNELTSIITNWIDIEDDN
jgi:hypothetical protein